MTNREDITCVAIDDEPMALLVIEQFCRRRGGMELTCFSEPRVGLEAIRQQQPDLVFLDIQMNSISGLDIADACRPTAVWCLLRPMRSMRSRGLISMRSIFCSSRFRMSGLKWLLRKPCAV